MVITFLYSLFLCLLFPLFFPSSQLPLFAPFLVLCYYKRPLLACLWWSFACGVISDLFSAHSPFGIHAINFCVATLLLYRTQYYFFEDGRISLPLMTAIFSCVFLLLQTGLLMLAGDSIVISWEWAADALVQVPLQGALFAALAYSLPAYLLAHLRRRRYAR